MYLFLLIFPLFIIGFPVAYSLGIIGLLGILIDKNLSLLVATTKIFHAVDSYALLAAPFFMLAGELMNRGKITDVIFDFATKVVGFIPGGLGLVNVVASMIFSGMSGSACADAAGLGRVEIKAMTERGYDREFSAAVTAASATIGPIVPPSIPFVIYGVIASVSIGKLLLAGFLPGIIMGFAMMIICYIRGLQRNYPRVRRSPLREILKTGIKAFPALMTPVILIGGMITGLFTPTEAGVVACVYAVLVGKFIYKAVKFSELLQILIKVATDCAAVLFIVIGASLFSTVLGRMRVPQQLAELLLNVSDNRIIVLLMINAFLLILGCFLDCTSALIVTTPVLLTLALQINISLVQFGVIMVFNLMIGLITPPFGLNMFITCDIAEISMSRFLKEVWPFIIILIVVLMLITYVPSISLSIPNLLIK